MTSVTGYRHQTRASVTCPDVPSASNPILHDSVKYPIPKAPTEYTVDEETEEASSDSSCDAADPDYESKQSVHLVNIADLYELVRDFAMTKGQADLSSRLQEFNLLAPGATFATDTKFSTMDDTICYCVDVDGLLLSIGVQNDKES